MVKSFDRIFGITKRKRGRLILSQVMLFVAAIATVIYSSLITPLVNEGMGNGDIEAALRIGIWMLVLGVVVGISMVTGF